MPRWCCLALLLAIWPLYAQPFTISDPETLQPPTRDRVAGVIAAAKRDGWAPQAGPLRSAALRAYARAPLSTADAWFRLYAWAGLLGENEDHFVGRWIQAVNAANAGHSNLPRTFSMRRVPLGSSVSPELQAWMLGDAAFSTEFFAVVSPLDFLPGTLGILDGLFRANPERFKAYPSLALALAVVLDEEPPPGWPHGQVRPGAIGRAKLAPAAVFDWWVRQDQQSRTGRRLKRLRADELKFVIDAAAPSAELEWAQRSLDFPLNDLGRAYFLVRYRFERVALKQAIWPGATYRLQDIVAAGGICADQAYFASEVGKAFALPTLFFHGAGNDGRHAWIGYLDPDGNWKLDVGRYAESRYVTGYARDPQTWRELTDHELQFLKEHFRTQQSYRSSRVHAEFAVDMLAAGDVDGAVKAARMAVKFEPRNQDGWETLIEAVKRQGGGKPAEIVMREAAIAFRNYPDLEAFYVARVADSLRARGQTSEAENEIRRIALKNQGDRIDISVGQAREIVRRSTETQPLQEQVRTYNAVVDRYGPGGGMVFFDGVVIGFVEHLVQLQNRAEALKAVERARIALGASPQTQLDTELNRLQRAVERMPPTR